MTDDLIEKCIRLVESAKIDASTGDRLNLTVSEDAWNAVVAEVEPIVESRREEERMRKLPLLKRVALIKKKVEGYSNHSLVVDKRYFGTIGGWWLIERQHDLGGSDYTPLERLTLEEARQIIAKGLASPLIKDPRECKE